MAPVYKYNILSNLFWLGLVIDGAHMQVCLYDAELVRIW
uniref:Uncharacterized protein n=1 Tax=Lepeophtheirus salmonis TaxID=72036 RepID=A0A0K2VET7_LEPSM